MKLVAIFSMTVAITACSALPRHLPPEQFRAEIGRGDYATQTKTRETYREYRYGIPTGRTIARD